MSAQDDMLVQAQGLNKNLANLNSTLTSRFALSAFGGSFRAAAAASTTITDANALPTSRIFLQATNAAAGTLSGAATHLYVATKNKGSFIVTTASGVAAAGTETFDYIIVNTG